MFGSFSFTCDAIQLARKYMNVYGWSPENAANIYVIVKVDTKRTNSLTIKRANKQTNKLRN